MKAKFWRTPRIILIPVLAVMLGLVSYGIVYAATPSTSLAGTPAASSEDFDATFSFSAAAADIDHFECTLDAGLWSACSSPLTYTNLAAGEHVFSARAVDNVGNTDDSPPTWTWSIFRRWSSVLFWWTL